MVLKIVVVVAALIVAVLVFAAARPNSFRVQRSIVINAPADKIFGLINDLRAWESWQPDDGKDVTMKKTFIGPASGTGAAAEWDSQGRGGKGRLVISESVPLSKVAIKADFVRPFGAHNVNEFILQPDAGGTKVTWSIQASNLYAMKLIGVFLTYNVSLKSMSTLG